MQGMSKRKAMAGSKKLKSHFMNSQATMPKDMPMMDMDKEMGNMKGMCRMVSSKD